MHPLITIFCPFTRRWAIDDWLVNLAGVEHDPGLTNLCAIVDGDEPYIVNMIKKFAETRGYRSFHLKANPNWHPNEVRLTIRRHRIADIHEQAKDLIAKCDGEIVIGLEDDTMIDRLPNFDRLIRPLAGSDAVGFVEGVQMGRHNTNMIGAWLMDDVHNPDHAETLLPGEDYQEISGGGWYGFATRRDLFLNTPRYASPSFPWGPDVNFGLEIRRRGFTCLVDWATVFGHREYQHIVYPDDPKVRLAKIVYNKRGDNGKWERTDHEPSRH